MDENALNIIYYFVYGSNMNHKQMKCRCPNARFISKAKLNGYKFVYDGYSYSRKGAVANIIKSDIDVVEGGVWEIDDECLQTLDKYEGYPCSYQKQIIEVKDDEGKSYQAIVYLRNPRKIGEPSKEYRDIVLEDAHDCGLSKRYIKDFIES